MFFKGEKEFSCGFSVGVDVETEGKHETFESQMEKNEQCSGKQKVSLVKC